MNKKQYIQNEVDNTLRSLEGIQRMEANPFLFTRIKAKMQRETSGWENLVSFITRPAFAISAMVLILLINGLFVIQSGGQSNSIDAGQVANFTSTYDVSGEYSQFATTNYELENIPNE